jgi:hypothetical protein
MTVENYVLHANGTDRRRPARHTGKGWSRRLVVVRGATTWPRESGDANGTGPL